MKQTNAEWMQENGYKFSDLQFEQLNSQKWKIYWGDECIGRYPKPSCMIDAALNWLDMEHKEPLLDDAEKRYLSAVLEPFRDRFQYITKEGNSHGEWIHIVLTNDSFSLPFFKPGTMYKNLTPHISYTLGDLGL